MANINNFNGAAAGKYDPGPLVIFYDDRASGPPSEENKTSYLQSFWLGGMIRLGWPSVYARDLEPGKLRLIWYTHAGVEGTRDHPLWKAATVKEMYDSLSSEYFRPMILGFEHENPFPQIGGHEPPPEPKKVLPKAPKSVSGSYSGHSGAKNGATPHDRIMAIIEQEDEREAKAKRREFELAHKADELAV